MLAETLHPLVNLSNNNSRSKDVYDNNLFWVKTNIEHLRSALKATFAFRRDDLPASILERIQEIDTTNLRKGWENAVLSLKDRPKFDDIYHSDLLLAYGGYVIEKYCGELTWGMTKSPRSEASRAFKVLI